MRTTQVPIDAAASSDPRGVNDIGIAAEEVIKPAFPPRVQIWGAGHPLGTGRVHVQGREIRFRAGQGQQPSQGGGLQTDRMRSRPASRRALQVPARE